MWRKIGILSAIVLIPTITILIVFLEKEPANWISYKNKDWGLSMSLPPDWKITEQRVTKEWNDAQVSVGGAPHQIGELRAIILESGGYTIIVNRDSGRGLYPDKAYSSPDYLISGHKASAFEDDSGSGISLFLSIRVDSHDYSFLVSSKNSKSKEIVDSILKTVVVNER